MKVLLVGEYSRLHNSLKEGLKSLGHEAHIVGSGDEFKNFPVDFSISPKFLRSYTLLQFLNKISLRLFHFNLEDIERGFRFYKLLPTLKNYDVVQLINSDALRTFPSWEILLFKKLFFQNGKIALLICGEDTPIIEVLLKNNLKYSVLTPYLENKKLKLEFRYSLKYISERYRKLFDFVSSNCNSCIASDLDYKIPLEQTSYHFHFIPNPINIDKIQHNSNPIIDKIVIFHGINALSAIKKGNHFFEKALEQISKLYADKIKIITVTSIPYSEYEQKLNQAHIVLDQVYGFDQGYNALEAMAKGKVVFTGAEKEFLEHYNLQEDEVAINALPDVDYLVRKLSFLIENPHHIKNIGDNARRFIENKHDYKKIAKEYVTTWESSVSFLDKE